MKGMAMSTSSPSATVTAEEAAPRVDVAKRKRARRGCITARRTREGMRYYANYIDADGKRKNKLVSTTSAKDARDKLADIRVRVFKGERGIPERTKEDKAQAHITIKELGERFTAEYVSSKIKDIKQYQREAKAILRKRVYPHIGHIAAAQLKTKQVDALINTLSSDVRRAGTKQVAGVGFSGSSVRSAVAALSRMYSWARKLELITCANPVTGCEKPRTNASLEYLARDEIRTLLDYLEGLSVSFAASSIARSLHAIVAFCLYTGVRKGEAMGLRWQDLHLDGSAARVDVMRSYAKEPKSGHTRHVPLGPEILRTLREWRDRPNRLDGGLVFPVPVDGRSPRPGTCRRARARARPSSRPVTGWGGAKRCLASETRTPQPASSAPRSLGIACAIPWPLTS
jgi:integrase